MKRLLLPIFTIFILASCSHYESATPLGPPEKSSVEESLLGEWILSDEKKENETSGFLNVMAFNHHEYLVQLYELADSSEYIESVLNLRMFSTQIKKDNYFNLIFLGPDAESSYMIYRLKEISGNRYKLMYLSKDKFELKFENPESFKKYVETNQKEFNKAFLPEGILSRKID